jgi:hypothetical protein
MHRYKEDEIITIKYCDYLHYLNGNVNELTPARSLFKSLILKFNLLILQKKLLDIDIFLNSTLKILIKKHYKDSYTLDDLSYLHTFFSQLFFIYLKSYPCSKYIPTYIDYKPVVRIEKIETKLNLDLILTQTNKDSFIHLILFVNDLDEFNIKNNPFFFFKLKLLKKLYTRKKKKYEPVKIHLLYIPDPTFRNRSQRDYRIKIKTLDLSYYQNIDTELYKLFFENFYYKKPTPRYFCDKKNCIKRKECLNGYTR